MSIMTRDPKDVGSCGWRKRMKKRWKTAAGWLNILITIQWLGKHQHGLRRIGELWSWKKSLRFKTWEFLAIIGTDAVEEVVGEVKLRYVPLFILPPILTSRRHKNLNRSLNSASRFLKTGPKWEFGHGGQKSGSGQCGGWDALRDGIGWCQGTCLGVEPAHHNANPDPPYFQTCPWTSITHSRVCRWNRSSACF